MKEPLRYTGYVPSAYAAEVMMVGLGVEDTAKGAGPAPPVLGSANAILVALRLVSGQDLTLSLALSEAERLADWVQKSLATLRDERRRLEGG